MFDMVDDPETRRVCVVSCRGCAKLWVLEDSSDTSSLITCDSAIVRAVLTPKYGAIMRGELGRRLYEGGWYRERVGLVVEVYLDGIE